MGTEQLRQRSSRHDPKDSLCTRLTLKIGVCFRHILRSPWQERQETSILSLIDRLHAALSIRLPLQVLNYKQVIRSGHVELRSLEPEMGVSLTRRGRSPATAEQALVGAPEASLATTARNSAVRSMLAAESSLAARRPPETEHERWMRREREKRERISARAVTHEIRYHLHLQRLRWAVTDFTIGLGVLVTAVDALGGDHSTPRLIAGLVSLTGGSASAAWHLHERAREVPLIDFHRQDLPLGGQSEG